MTELSDLEQVRAQIRETNARVTAAYAANDMELVSTLSRVLVGQQNSLILLSSGPAEDALLVAIGPVAQWIGCSSSICILLREKQPAQVVIISLVWIWHTIFTLIPNTCIAAGAAAGAYF